MMKRILIEACVWLGCGAGLWSTGPAAAQVPRGKRPVRAAPARVAHGFDLFGSPLGERGVRLTANRVDCNGLTDFGNHCTDLTGSGTVEGGYWPRGTPDNYVFNGGLQVGATIPSDAGFEWAGDTVGVFFMDPRGDQRNGVTVTGLFDSRNANDVAAWPSPAYANDQALFDASLIGRAAVSDEDTWVRYWDGVPSYRYGGGHMMGMLVDQRTMAWSRPYQQDIVYFVMRLINVTSRLPSSYAGLAAAGYSTTDQQQLAALGAAFQDSAEAHDAALQIPDGGYVFHDLYAAYYQDVDVGNASFNFSTAVLPFSLVAGLKSNYAEPTWIYPATVFGPPFAAAPGFEAIQFLRGVADSGGGRTRIAVWSNTCGGCGLENDPVGVRQMYRYISGHGQPALGDGTCNSDPILLHTCAALQSAADSRYYASTGPVDLAPGHAALVVVAMVYAAPVAQWAATTNGIYAMPAGQLSSYLGTDASSPGQTFFPGFPATAETLAVAGTAGGSRVCTNNCGNKLGTIREPVERAMGWGQFGDVNADGRIEAGEVQTVPGSLLHKAQVAQALFDHGFLMPRAPEPPAFFLVPGDNSVTIAWEKSATETTGDPYFAVASAPLNGDGSANPLYDPDYRRYDVVGYRIWRGTSPSSLQVIAEFDYSNQRFTDYTGQFVSSYLYGNQCAPELGVTTTCPPFPVQVPLAGDVVQVPLGGRILDQRGSVVLLQADTVHISSYYYFQFPDPPFVFADSSVKNGFTYYYAVTALDFNSVRSGPPSLESPLAPKMVTPRVSSGQETGGSIGTTVMLGGDGAPLTGTMPALDPRTGEFSGPMPPTNGIGFGLVSFLPQVLDTGSVTLTIDSVVPADGWDGQPGTYYYSVRSPGLVANGSVGLQVPISNWTDAAYATSPALRAVQARAARFGGDSGYVGLDSLSLTTPGTWELTNWGRGAANDAPTGNDKQGPRWWVGSANENTPDPNIGMCGAANFGCNPTPANLAKTAGSLGAGNQVMIIEGYMTVPTQPMRQIHAMTSSLARAADFRVYWGAGGAVDSVHDVTHHVTVPFSPVLRASWGILNDSSFTTTSAWLTPDKSNAFLRWDDVTCIAPIAGPRSVMLSALTTAQACGGTGQVPAVLMNHARLSPVVFRSSAFADTLTALRTPTGNGFIFYLAGQFFLMQLAALPAPGTVWNLRTYAGDVVGTTGSYAWVDATRPPAVPGLQIRLSYTGSTFTPLVSNAAELAAVHTVPDPYYNHDAFETGGAPRQIHFVNLPARCIIRIYSASGILVRVLTHNDPTGGGEAVWDVTNRGGGLVASGVYFYHVEAPDGKTKIGRLTIVTMTAN